MKSQLARFGSIGALNTAVDFALFALLTNAFGMHYVAANIVSTGSALVLSFFLNGKVTFKSRLSGRSAALFLTTTLIGLWVLQPVVITLSEPLLRPLLSSVQLQDFSLLAAKVIATGFSLTWNFLLYKYLVFPSESSDSER